jgi:hypothetical protein
MKFKIYRILIYNMSKLSEVHERERTTVSLTRNTYEKLKRKGFAGESFDDVINKLLVQQKEEIKK